MTKLSAIFEDGAEGIGGSFAAKRGQSRFFAVLDCLRAPLPPAGRRAPRCSDLVANEERAK